MDAPRVISARCKYPVFISYSHRDERWARWLHKAIDGYRVPKPLVGRPGRNGPITRQIFPVFRDRDELASSADLPSVLREALAQSSHLIVLCSPAAARSRYVNQEIIEFKLLGRADRILPLIVDGEPYAKAPQDECFPPALRFEIDAAGNLTDQPAEPVAADLRPEGDGRPALQLVSQGPDRLAGSLRTSPTRRRMAVFRLARGENVRPRDRQGAASATLRTPKPSEEP